MVTFDFATSGDFADICAAVIRKPDGVEIWPKKRQPNGLYAAKLSSIELVEIAMTLFGFYQDNVPVFGWGSLGYDLRLLYKDSPAKEETLSLALNHIDLQFILFCATASLINLDSVVKAYGVTVDRTIPKETPNLWKEGKLGQNKAVDHLVDVVYAIEVIAKKYVDSREITWINPSNEQALTVKSTAPSNWAYLYPSFFLPEKILLKKFFEITSWVRQAAKEQANGTSSYVSSKNNSPNGDSIKSVFALG